MILTRRRGGTEEDAQKQRGSQERRARRQRRSGGYAARRARQGKFGGNAMTKNQRIAGRFPEREGSRTYGAAAQCFFWGNGRFVASPGPGPAHGAGGSGFTGSCRSD